MDFGKMIKDFFLDMFTEILKFMIDILKATVELLGKNIKEISQYYNIVIAIASTLMVVVALTRIVSAMLAQADQSKQVTASNILMDTIKASVSIPIMLFLQKMMVSKIVVPVGKYLFDQDKKFTADMFKSLKKINIDTYHTVQVGGFITILFVLFFCIVIGFFFYKVSVFVVNLAYFNLSIPLVAVSIVTENMDYSREWWQKLLYSCLTMLSQILSLTISIYGITHLRKGLICLMLAIGGGTLVFVPPFILDNLWTTTGMTKKGLGMGRMMMINMFRNKG